MKFNREKRVYKGPTSAEILERAQAMKSIYPKVNIRSREMLPQYNETEMELLASRVGLTRAQLKEIGSMAHQTYQQLGADLAESSGGKGIRRAALIEVVLDANYMETFNHGMKPELKEWLYTKSTRFPLGHVYEAIAAEAFRYPDYE